MPEPVHVSVAIAEAMALILAKKPVMPRRQCTPHAPREGGGRGVTPTAFPPASADRQDLPGQLFLFDSWEQVG
jgi:hypothetical protein